MSDKVTVKQTINKATSIYKIEHITVGKPGSEQYRHAFELADQLGLKHPDCIEHVFPTYADEQCTHVLTEEDFFSTEEREGVDRCIGVICSSVSYSLMSMKMVVLDTNSCTKAMSLNVMNMAFSSKA
nr:hypothetical protein [Escherichia coli]